jgi:AraC-like DNA-binding protein/GNAT superfamily N-acetyltransferase
VANDRDIPLLQAIERSANRKYATAGHPELADDAVIPIEVARRAIDREALIVAAEDDQPVGWVYVADSDDGLVVGQISVSESYGRAGIGSSLIGAAMNVARQRSHRAIVRARGVVEMAWTYERRLAAEDAMVDGHDARTELPSYTSVGFTDATVPVVVARAILSGAEERGVPPEVLAGAVGLDLELLEHGDARAPARVMARLWEEAGRLTGDDAFGLHVGKASAASAMPLAGRIIRASGTLGEGLARLMAYYRVFNDVHPADVAVEGDEILVRVLTGRTPIGLPRHAIEFAFSWFVAVASLALGERVRLAGVTLEHEPPQDPGEHARFFGCEVTFAASETSFRAPRALFEQSTAAPDPHLVEILESHAEILLAKLPERASTTARVRAVVAELLPRGDATIELVAEAMGSSPRTLQRKLRDDGTTFSELADQLRCERAKEHLRELSRSIAEVALLVGFSDQSTFHRAFVRWTGKTPGDFRRGRP